VSGNSSTRLSLRDTVLRANDCRGCERPSALFVYGGAVATLGNVTLATNLPSGHAIDCDDRTNVDHFLPDGHFTLHVVDSGDC